MASGASGARAVSLPRRPTGRPPRELSPAQVAKVCELVEAGVPPGSAASVVAGVPRRTFQHWLEWGRGDGAREPYRSLAAKLETALERWHASRCLHLEDVLRDEKADPRTRANVVMWELERRFADDWADHSRGNTTVNVQVTLELERRELSARMLEAAARVLGENPELLERFAAEISGEVVDGSARELPGIAAA